MTRTDLTNLAALALGGCRCGQPIHPVESAEVIGHLLALGLVTAGTGTGGDVVLTRSGALVAEGIDRAGVPAADTARRALRAAALRRSQAEQDRAASMRAIALYARAALDAHVPIAEVAALSGVSRPTVYAMLSRFDG